MSLTSSSNRKTKNLQLEQDVDQVLYSALDRRPRQKKTMVTPCQKKRDMFLSTQDINKKSARRGSVLRAICGPPDKNDISIKL